MTPRPTANLTFKPHDKQKLLYELALIEDEEFFCSLWIADEDGEYLTDKTKDHVSLSVGMPWAMTDEEIAEGEEEYVYGHISIDTLVDDMIELYEDDAEHVAWLAARFRSWATRLEEAHAKRVSENITNPGSSNGNLGEHE